jgi:coatomer subunit beta'
VEQCIDLLIETKRVPEACFLSRTYMPSRIEETLALWKKDLATVNEKAAEALADPTKYPNLFPDLDVALKVEQMFLAGRDRFVPATSYSTAKAELTLDLCAIVKAQAAAGVDVMGVVTGESKEQEPIVIAAVEVEANDDEEVEGKEDQQIEVEAEEEEEEEEVEVEVIAAPAPAPVPVEAPVVAEAPAPAPVVNEEPVVAAPAPAVVDSAEKEEEDDLTADMDDLDLDGIDDADDDDVDFDEDAGWS